MNPEAESGVPFLKFIFPDLKSESGEIERVALEFNQEKEEF